MRFFTALLTLIIFGLWIFIIALLMIEDKIIEEPLLGKDIPSVFKTNPALFPCVNIYYKNDRPQRALNSSLNKKIKGAQNAL